MNELVPYCLASNQDILLEKVVELNAMTQFICCQNEFSSAAPHTVEGPDVPSAHYLLHTEPSETALPSPEIFAAELEKIQGFLTNVC